MKVYIVVDNDCCEGVTIKKVFLEKQNAETYAGMMREENRPFEVQEYEAADVLQELEFDAGCKQIFAIVSKNMR